MRTTKMLTILVLILESMAHGSIDLTVNDQPLDSIVLEAGESCTVEIVSDSSFSYEGYIGFYDGLSLGSFTHLQTGPAAGNRAMVTQYDDGSFSGYKATPDGFLQRPGVHFVFEFEAEQAGETDVILAEMFKDELTSIDSVHITVTRGPMGTAFTYQGSLNDAGSPADGSYDFEFKLYNSPADGNQVGTTLDVKELDVISGQFAVKLDFGSDVFDGDARWLEIGVRPGEDPNEYTILLPRIELTPTPYALFAKNAAARHSLDAADGDPIEAVYVDNEGNVGIGTTAPENAKLHVFNDGSTPQRCIFVRTLGGAMTNAITAVHGNSGASAVLGQYDYAVNAVIGPGSTASIRAFNVDNSYQTLLAAERFALEVSGPSYFDGKVGIGTEAPEPAYKLTVDGEGSSNGIYVNNVGAIGMKSIGANYGLIASGDIQAVRGIGSATGGYFEANGERGVGVYGVATDENGVGIYARGGSNGYAGRFDGNVIIMHEDTAAEVITLSDNGDVVIRDNNTGGKVISLSNSGRTTTKVLEITGGADLSEQFEISSEAGEVKPGMVVSIDAESSGDLVVSNKGYDRRVAGIISGAGGLRPGMLMGQKGSKADGKNPVALTGRVYCWADASNVAIRPGDLLTTSDTPGHAMKVKDYKRAQGAILGKAMSPLESGRGLVLVLVTLQ